MSFIAIIRQGTWKYATSLTPFPASFGPWPLTMSISIGGPSFMLGGGSPAIIAESFSDCTCPTVTTPTLPPTADPPFPPVYPYLFSTNTIYGRDNLSLNLVMVREDDYEFDATAILNGNPVNLTGGSLFMTAKWAVTDADSDALFQLAIGTGITLTNPTMGQFHCKIDHSLTQPLPLHTVYLPYDIEFVDTAGNIRTLTLGTLKVVPDVTNDPLLPDSFPEDIGDPKFGGVVTVEVEVFEGLSSQMALQTTFSSVPQIAVQLVNATVPNVNSQIVTESSYTVLGALPEMTPVISCAGLPTGLGFVNAYFSAANTLKIRWANVTSGNITGNSTTTINVLGL